MRLFERLPYVIPLPVYVRPFSTAKLNYGEAAGKTNRAPIKMLEYISKKSFFQDYLELLPILAVDGSLAFVTDFQADPTLAGAKGNVYAKTGTKIEPTPDGLLLNGQALGGYIITKSGKTLMYELAVNNVPLGFDITSVQQVFQDQGTISAIIWRDN